VYGFVERIEPDGKYTGYVSHSSNVHIEGRELSASQGEFVSVISKQASDYAERRGWPNDERGVLSVIHYSERPHGLAGFIHRISRLLKK
jgi:hypothetical protein